MTEKRFTIVNMGLDGRLIKKDGKIIELERVVDLLNENEQLKRKNKGLQSELHIFKEDVTHSNKIIDKLNDENKQLKSDLTRVIEQARKNNELLVSDIRTLEKALWCSGCENDYDRLRQLRKEFLK